MAMTYLATSSIYVLIQTALVTSGLYLANIIPMYDKLQSYIQTGSFPRLAQASYYALFSLGALAIGQLLMGGWVAKSYRSKSIGGIVP